MDVKKDIKVPKIITFIGIILLASFVSFSLSKLLNILIKKEDNKITLKETQTIKLNHISFTYNTDKWVRLISNSKEYEILNSDKDKLLIKEIPNDEINTSTLEEFLNNFKNNCYDSCKVINDIEPLDNNGYIWYKLVTSKNNYNNLYLYYKDDNYTYNIIYSALKENYDEKRAQEILKTIKFEEDK